VGEREGRSEQIAFFWIAKKSKSALVMNEKMMIELGEG